MEPGALGSVKSRCESRRDSASRRQKAGSYNRATHCLSLLQSTRPSTDSQSCKCFPEPFGYALCKAGGNWNFPAPSLHPSSPNITFPHALHQPQACRHPTTLLVAWACFHPLHIDHSHIPPHPSPAHLPHKSLSQVYNYLICFVICSIIAVCVTVGLESSNGI